MISFSTFKGCKALDIPAEGLVPGVAAPLGAVLLDAEVAASYSRAVAAPVSRRNPALPVAGLHNVSVEWVHAAWTSVSTGAAVFTTGLCHPSSGTTVVST